MTWRCGRLGTRRASVVYGIPRSTLRNKIYKLEAADEQAGLPAVYKRRRAGGQSSAEKLLADAVEKTAKHIKLGSSEESVVYMSFFLSFHKKFWIILVRNAELAWRKQLVPVTVVDAIQMSCRGKYFKIDFSGSFGFWDFFRLHSLRSRQSFHQTDWFNGKRLMVNFSS